MILHPQETALSRHALGAENAMIERMGDLILWWLIRGGESAEIATALREAGFTAEDVAVFGSRAQAYAEAQAQAALARRAGDVP